MRWLSDSDVERLLTPDKARAAVSAALRAISLGTVDMPQRLAVDRGAGPTLVMPAELDDPLALGVKILSLRSGNSERGLPAIVGAVLLQDPGTGQPTLGMDAAVLTGRRTAALSAVATAALAREDAATLGVFGAGFQAFYHIEAIAAVRALREVRSVNRSEERARRLAERVRHELGLDAVVTSGDDAAGCDIIVTVTASAQPVLRTVLPGRHVNLIGAYRPEAREAAAAVLAGARVYVDAMAPCREEAGDIVLAASEGALSWDDVHEIGELLLGRTEGRQDLRDVTVFKSVGCAAFDLACAASLLG